MKFRLVLAAAGTVLAAFVAVPAVAGAASTSWPECYGVFPISGAKAYAQGCYGHDEPMIDPVSSTPGSGQDITWTFKLPTSSASRSLLDLGPTFWVGATLSDSSAVADRAFSELQFYPDSSLLPQQGSDINTACTQFGFNVNYDPGTWSICDFTWGLYGTAPSNWQETAAYVKVLDESSHSNEPLYMHSGDLVRVHVFDSGDSNNDAEQVITDLTTHKTGSMIMYSNSTTGAGSAANPGQGDGPLTLPYSTNTTDNMMPWGVVAGTPFAFSWEIGHSNFYNYPLQAECVPGQWDCFSYDTTSTGWGAVKPFQLLSATFGIGHQDVTPSSWATNDGQGGAGEDSLWCGVYNQPGVSSCTFPWYTYNGTDNAMLLGNDYPGTTNDYGQAPAEYTQSQQCPGPLTAQYGFTYYCDTTLSPTPPIK